MTSYEVREMRDADLESWLECARASFGPERAKSRRQWEWAFRRPGFRTQGMVAVRDGEVLAGYLGIAQQVWIGGEERVCVQPVDLMVRPDARRGLQRRGLYIEVAEAFIDHYGTQGTDVFHYGWPIEAARRSGQRLMGYEFVREELCLVREIGSESREFPEEVSDVTDFGEELRWLWDRCASEWGAGTIRDGAWWRWRFVEKPDCEYRLLGVRDASGLRGVAVLRGTAWEWPGVLPVCDWLVPDGDHEAAVLLERALESVAVECGVRSWVAVFPDTSLTFASFQERGWRVRTSPYTLVARSYDPRFDVDWLRAHWWYDLADSDLA